MAKILELTNYSAGICGVWNRVKEESERLTKLGHEIRVFSSNRVKGSNETAERSENKNQVKIRRFPSKKLGGESYMNWENLGELQKEIKKYKPDVIIAHSYRHRHTVLASKIARKIGAKSFLVTHAPFGDSTRSKFAKLYIRYFHDLFIGRSTLKRFNKIIIISKWEIPYLRDLGIQNEKIEYLPNGIPQEFFKQSKSKENNKILFLGRISPVKDLETLIKAISMIKDKKIKLEIVGPAEREYLNKLKILINKLDLSKRVSFSKPIYNIKEKINKIDSAKIFVLPSKREGMPQSLIEAMARKKIVISSNNSGSKDLILNGKNGHLFKIGDSRELADRIDLSLKKDNFNMKKEARQSVEKFSWNKIIEQLNSLINLNKM